MSFVCHCELIDVIVIISQATHTLNNSSKYSRDLISRPSLAIQTMSWYISRYILLRTYVLLGILWTSGVYIHFCAHKHWNIHFVSFQLWLLQFVAFRVILVTLTLVYWFAYDFAFTFYLLKLKCHKFQNVSSLIATQSVYLLSNTDFHFNKKSLKISKGQSESVYRRRTDNTMAKRKCAKGQTTIYKTYI